jgi:hypothetical protein
MLGWSYSHKKPQIENGAKRTCFSKGPAAQLPYLGLTRG